MGNVIGLYGDRPQRYLPTPAIRVSMTQMAGPPGNCYRPGPHDLQAVAGALNGATQPLWDILIGREVIGTPIEDELHPSTLQLLAQIAKGEYPNVLVLEHPWLWYPMMLRHFAQPQDGKNAVYVQAFAQTRVAETIGLLANSPLTIVLLADEAMYHNGNSIPAAYHADLPRGLREYVTHDVRVVADTLTINGEKATREDLQSLFGAPFQVIDEAPAKPAPAPIPSMPIPAPVRVPMPVTLPKIAVPTAPAIPAAPTAAMPTAK